MELTPAQNPLFPEIDNLKTVIDAKKLTVPFAIKGKVNTKAEFRNLLRKKTAAEAIGDIYPSFTIMGITKGQFSLTDILSTLFKQTGPVHMFISTWTAASQSLLDLSDIMKSGRLLSVRFLVDHTFQRRKPHDAATMRDLFGVDAIRVTMNHAKICLIRNDQWNIVLKTTMNLNMNPRLEHFDIQDDIVIADYFQAVFDEIFSSLKPGNIFDPPFINEARFKKL